MSLGSASTTPSKLSDTLLLKKTTTQIKSIDEVAEPDDHDESEARKPTPRRDELPLLKFLTGGKALQFPRKIVYDRFFIMAKTPFIESRTRCLVFRGFFRAEHVLSQERSEVER